MRRGMTAPREIKKYQTSTDKKVAIPEIGKRDCARNEAQPTIPEHCGEGSAGSRRGLPYWATGTSKFVCSTHGMCDHDSQRYTVDQTNKGGYLI